MIPRGPILKPELTDAEVADLEERITKLSNSLTDAQKKELSVLLEGSMRYHLAIRHLNNFDLNYFGGVVDGLNTAYKIVNGLHDEYVTYIRLPETDIKPTEAE